LGKNKVEEDESDSDSDVDDEDSEDDESADAKSVVVDDGNCSNGSSKNEEEKLDMGSVSGSHSEGESSGEKSQHSNSEENVKCVQSTVELTTRSGAEGGDFESDGSAEPEVGMVDHPFSVNSAVAAASEEVKADEDNTTSATSYQNNTEVPQVEEALKADEDNTASATSNQNNPVVPQVEECADANKSYSEPLDLSKYSSAAELEVCFFFMLGSCLLLWLHGSQL
jgi:hypothetical protein